MFKKVIFFFVLLAVAGCYSMKSEESIPSRFRREEPAVTPAPIASSSTDGNVDKKTTTAAQKNSTPADNNSTTLLPPSSNSTAGKPEEKKNEPGGAARYNFDYCFKIEQSF